MANPEHVELLRLGVDAIATWRATNPDVHLDLEKAELEGIVLDGADLRGARLHEAKMQGAHLVGANLQHAGLRDAQLNGANLRGARLQHSRLVKTNLTLANLAWARFYRAHLHGAYLQEADLQNANLQDAYLLWASLVRARMRGAYLDRAEMQWCNLQEADLQQARLHEANLQEAVLGQTTFQQTCLAAATALHTCRHQTPSRFDFGSLAQSGHLPQRFLTDCGWPPELAAQALDRVEALPQLAVIERALPLPPAWQPAGVGLLSEAVIFWQRRHPDALHTCRIEQRAEMVRLVIETPVSQRDTLEHTVQAFGSVLRGDTQPEDLMQDGDEVRDFEQRRAAFCAALCPPRQSTPSTSTSSAQMLSAAEQCEQVYQLLGNALLER